jgi:hypothetical protein
VLFLKKEKAQRRAVVAGKGEGERQAAVCRETCLNRWCSTTGTVLHRSPQRVCVRREMAAEGSVQLLPAKVAVSKCLRRLRQYARAVDHADVHSTVLNPQNVAGMHKLAQAMRERDPCGAASQVTRDTQVRAHAPCSLRRHRSRATCMCVRIAAAARAPHMPPCMLPMHSRRCRVQVAAWRDCCCMQRQEWQEAWDEWNAKHASGTVGGEEQGEPKNGAETGAEDKRDKEKPPPKEPPCVAPPDQCAPCVRMTIMHARTCSHSAAAQAAGAVGTTGGRGLAQDGVPGVWGAGSSERVPALTASAAGAGGCSDGRSAWLLARSRAGVSSACAERHVSGHSRGVAARRAARGLLGLLRDSGACFHLQHARADRLCSRCHMRIWGRE